MNDFSYYVDVIEKCFQNLACKGYTFEEIKTIFMLALKLKFLGG